MAKQKQKRLRISLRLKLLLVASSLLIIPWVGSKYIKEQELAVYLQDQQAKNLLSHSQILAAFLETRPDLFHTQSDEPLPTKQVQHIFVRPLHSQIQLDGYLDDWQPYRERMQMFNLTNAVKGSEDSNLSFQHQIGTYGRYLYIVFQIEDDKIVYRNPNSASLNQSDHLQIALQDKSGTTRKYIVTTIAPGWVNAHEMTSLLNDPRPLRPETRIKGEWQETTRGYNIELRIPLSLLGKRLSFAIADVDQADNPEIDTLISTAGISDSVGLGTLMFPSEEAESMLARMQQPLTRTWVIDLHNRVIARTGSLVQDENEYSESEKKEYSFFSGLLSVFYKLVLKQPATEFHDELLNASRLNSEEFRQALAGNPYTRWRQTADKETYILTATYPVYANDRIIGAVAIEKTSHAIQSAENKAFQVIFNVSALVFLGVIIILLTFATRLSLRVRRLRDATELAITEDGRVVGEIKASNDSDEIGDLTRGVSDMLDRITQYNRYLEGMASKLSHELRTPITVVRSSLENLNSTDENSVYIERARQGVERLSDILSRMSEATRLEQTIQSEQAVEFDLAKVIEGCIEGYRLAKSDIAIEFNIEDGQDFAFSGTPELIAQMLDKLISNAVDFHTVGTPIVVSLKRLENEINLTVSNSGPILPAEMQQNLFESMVSVRAKKGEQPHLGLGLYIVRLIVEYHKGKVSAKNQKDESGVRFDILLPCTTS